ncbi:MAG: DNA-binding protein, partial [Bacteroidetes bacterium QH_1_61_8]
MATTASRPQDVPTISKPTPNPTHPVAGRSVTDGAPTFEWT